MTATAPRILARVDSYDALIEALRAQKAVTDDLDTALDVLAGLPAGYTGKLFGPMRVKKMSVFSMLTIAEALGTALALIEDDASKAARAKALQRMQHKLPRRQAANSNVHGVRLTTGMIKRAKVKIYQDLARKSAVARRCPVNHPKRSRAARTAAENHWIGRRSRSRRLARRRKRDRERRKRERINRRRQA